ncbi:MAG: putative selenium-dependent hydroxylase accessory protein YqeC, partial [Deltaproteobacteria bacterium]|nr:putative selenium-dependent hydroxylase accessory protein YqeC [Deltaproteobacteria bacterium]
MKEDLNTLRNAFQIASGEVISLVGGGGKTTLMFALARELAISGKVVITTTTTKIFPPDSTDSPCLLISGDAREIIDFIVKEGPRKGHVTIASEVELAPGKLRGIPPELISMLSEMESVATIIVEADGAAHRSLKAPNIDYEPVIPANSSLVIPVIGIDVLGCEMREEYVFRSDIA